MMLQGRSTAGRFSRRAACSSSWVAASAMLVAVGCGSTETRHEQVSNDTIYRYSAYRYQYPPSPPVMDGPSLREFVRQYQNKVVVLEFWASWSPTSRDDLPALAQLQEDAYPEGVRVVACTFDPPGEWASRVVPILQSAHAGYPCIVIPREARNDIREWLAPDWSYDLPARFVLDQEGRVSMRSFGGAPIDGIIVEARNLVGSRGGTHVRADRRMDMSTTSDQPASTGVVSRNAGGDDRTAMANGAVSLRTRLVDIARGEAASLPVVYSSSGNTDLLAAELTSLLAERVDRAQNPRIVILPFASTSKRTHPSPLGRDLADRLENGLHRAGFYDLVGGAAAESMVSDAGLSALAIDYDPSISRQRLPADYLLLGWLQGGASPALESLAGDHASDNPGAD